MKLSEMMKAGTFEPVTLGNVKETGFRYDFLEDCMKDEALDLLRHENELRKANGKPEWDTETLAYSLQYSLSCSQGDGVSFREGSTGWQELREGESGLSVQYVIRTTSNSNHYYHDRTFYVEPHFDGEETEEEYRKAETEADESTEGLRSICGKLEKYGYELIETEDAAEIAYQVTQAFFNKYDIREDAAETMYEWQEGPGKVYIGKIEGYTPEIYLPDFELKENTKETLENGKIVASGKFYLAA